MARRGRGGARRRRTEEDGGWCIGAECPNDRLASAGGAALRSAMVMFTRTTMIREGGLKRDQSAVGAALCCPTVAVRRSSPRHPTRDVAPRRVRARADDATEREKQHIEESREKKKKKKKQKRRLRCFRPTEPPEQHNKTKTNLYERAPRELVRREPSRAEPSHRTGKPPRRLSGFACSSG